MADHNRASVVKVNEQYPFNCRFRKGRVCNDGEGHQLISYTAEGRAILHCPVQSCNYWRAKK